MPWIAPSQPPSLGAVFFGLVSWPLSLGPSTLVPRTLAEHSEYTEWSLELKRRLTRPRCQCAVKAAVALPGANMDPAPCRCPARQPPSYFWFADHNAQGSNQAERSAGNQCQPPPPLPSPPLPLQALTPSRGSIIEDYRGQGRLLRIGIFSMRGSNNSPI